MPDFRQHQHAGIGHHIRRTIALAVPVVIARLGVLVMAAVDTIMTGRAGGQELAYLGLSMAPSIPLMLIGIGMLAGGGVLISQAHGAGESERCGMIWRVVMRHAVVIGLIIFALCLLGEPFFTLAAQPPDLIGGAARTLAAIGIGLPAQMLYIACIVLLEGTNRPLPGMVVMIAGNLLNIVLNMILINGASPISGMDIPPLGATGAMLATSIVRWVSFLSILAYLYLMPASRLPGLRQPVRDNGGIGRRMRRLGYPIAVLQGLETASFSVTSLFAGWIGAVAVAAYQVSFNLIALVFMVALGIATATGIRVGNAVGASDPVAARRAGWVGVFLVTAVFLPISGGMWLFSDVLAAVYSQDGTVAATAAGAIATIAAFTLFDGIQGTLVGAMRGYGETRISLINQIVSFWIIAIPGSLYLAFERGLGLSGLIYGLGAGMVAAAILNGISFFRVTRRPLRRA